MIQRTSIGARAQEVREDLQESKRGMARRPPRALKEEGWKRWIVPVVIAVLALGFFGLFAMQKNHESAAAIQAESDAFVARLEEERYQDDYQRRLQDEPEFRREEARRALAEEREAVDRERRAYAVAEAQAEKERERIRQRDAAERARVAADQAAYAARDAEAGRLCGSWRNAPDKSAVRARLVALIEEGLTFSASQDARWVIDRIDGKPEPPPPSEDGRGPGAND